MLSFCTIEEADDLLLSIGGVQTSRIPDVGTEIDLRGRKSFLCSLQNQKRRRAFDKGLVLVVDPSEIFVARCKKGDINRCIVLAVISLSTIIASASAGETLHVVCPMARCPTQWKKTFLKMEDCHFVSTTLQRVFQQRNFWTSTAQRQRIERQWSLVSFWIVVWKQETNFWLQMQTHSQHCVEGKLRKKGYGLTFKKRKKPM